MGFGAPPQDISRISVSANSDDIGRIIYGVVDQMTTCYSSISQMMWNIIHRQKKFELNSFKKHTELRLLGSTVPIGYYGVVPTTLDILLIEDNPGDQRLVREALATSGNSSRLHIIVNGLEALPFLRHEGKFSESPVPNIVLLDLNLPGRNGKDVLKEIKTDPVLSPIPVIIFSSSMNETDIAECLQLHAESFITKPIELHDFLEAVRGIERHWRSRALGTHL